MKISEIEITNPDKILSGNIRKIDVIKYYQDISPFILPFLKNRPLSEIRCHGGIENCFFRKHPQGQEDELIFVKDTKQIIKEVQLGTFEFHLNGFKKTNPNKPDIMVFDLDPDEKIERNKLLDGVDKLKNLLVKLNLTPYLKTSGGKGYHIVIPFKPSANWENFFEFSQKISIVLERQNPKLFTTNIRKSERKNKIFIDFLRNKKGSTCVAPYSLRARENLPISFPLLWSDLTKIKANDITIKNYKKYLNKNAWKDFFETNQAIK